jgi:hypothetical protein
VTNGFSKTVFINPSMIGKNFMIAIDCEADDRVFFALIYQLNEILVPHIFCAEFKIPYLSAIAKLIKQSSYRKDCSNEEKCCFYNSNPPENKFDETMIEILEENANSPIGKEGPESFEKYYVPKNLGSQIKFCNTVCKLNTSRSKRASDNDEKNEFSPCDCEIDANYKVDHSSTCPKSLSKFNGGLTISSPYAELREDSKMYCVVENSKSNCKRKLETNCEQTTKKNRRITSSLDCTATQSLMVTNCLNFN